MLLKTITAGTPDARKMSILNNEAFPDCERVDADELLHIAEQGRMDILGIYPDEEFAGFFAVRTLGYTAYIAFFAVCPEYRSRGVGGEALRLLREHYGGMQVVVDFESIRELCDNPEQRRRRRSFYLRNGFHETGRYMYYSGTEFEILCSEPELDMESFREMIAYIHSEAPSFDPEIYSAEEKRAVPEHIVKGSGMKETITELMKACGLAAADGDIRIQPVSGGLMHKMYRVEAGKGIFAVKHLNPAIMERPDAAENYSRAEALEALLEREGLPIVPAIRVNGKKMQRLHGGYFYIFRWLDGTLTDADTVTPAQCRMVGEILGRMHSIGTTPATSSRHEACGIDFERYHSIAEKSGSPVSVLLGEDLRMLDEVKKSLDSARQYLPPLRSICNDDMDPKNIMWSEGKPYVIDLECLEYGDPAACCVNLSLQWSGVPERRFDSERLKAFFDGYLSAYDSGYAEYHMLYGIAYSSWLEWLEYNLRRALGMEGNGEEDIRAGENEVRRTLGLIGYMYRNERIIRGALKQAAGNI